MGYELLNLLRNCVPSSGSLHPGTSIVETILGKSLGDNHAGVPISQIMGSIPFAVVVSDGHVGATAARGATGNRGPRILAKGTGGSACWEEFPSGGCAGHDVSRFFRSMPMPRVAQYAMKLEDLTGNRQFLKQSTKQCVVQLHFLATTGEWNRFVADRMSAPFTFGVTSLKCNDTEFRDISTFCFGIERSSGRDVLKCAALQCVRQARTASADRIMSAPASCHALAFVSTENQWHLYEAASAVDGTIRTDLVHFIQHGTVKLPELSVAVSEPALFTTENGTQLLATDNMSNQDVRNMRDLTQKAEAVACVPMLQSKGSIFKHAQCVCISGFLHAGNGGNLTVIANVDLRTAAAGAEWVAMRPNLLVETAPL